MKKIYFLSLALMLIVAPNALAQEPQDITPALTKEERAKVKALVGVSSQPVVYGKVNDGLPQSMRVSGVVTEVSFVPWACGVVCWWGTARIKLIEKVKGYEPEYAYVAVLCFMGKEEDYLNKIVDVRVSKLYQNEDARNCGGIVNTIDSGGVPFYRLRDKNKMKLKIVGAVKAQAATRNR